jgi:hypothetical protein
MATRDGKTPASMARRDSSKRRWPAMVAALVTVLFRAAQVGAQSAPPFRPNAMDTVLYGAAYHPEYMPYDRLDQEDPSLLPELFERISNVSFTRTQPASICLPARPLIKDRLLP